MTTFTADAALALGGRTWTGRTGVTRVYLNEDVWAPLIGLEVDRYKTGNVSYATLNGYPLSNAKATELLGIRVYVQDDRLHMEIPSRWRMDITPAQIAERIIAAAAQSTDAA